MLSDPAKKIWRERFVYKENDSKSHRAILNHFLQNVNDFWRNSDEQ